MSSIAKTILLFAILLSSLTYGQSCPDWVNNIEYETDDKVMWNDQGYKARRDVYQNTPPPEAWFWAETDECDGQLDELWETTGPNDGNIRNSNYDGAVIIGFEAAGDPEIPENAKLGVFGYSYFKSGNLTVEDADLVIKGQESVIRFTSTFDALSISRRGISIADASSSDNTSIDAFKIEVPKLTVQHPGGPACVIEDGNISTVGSITATSITTGNITSGGTVTTMNLVTHDVGASGNITANGTVSGAIVSSAHMKAGFLEAEEIKVYNDAFPDYVFKNDYQLKSLPEIESFIDENKHLPGIPTEEEVKKNGVNMGELQVKLLEKIEEMTLHMIKMQKRITELESQVND